MNKDIVSLASSPYTDTDRTKNQQLQTLVCETLAKFDVTLDVTQAEIKFLHFDISRYQQNNSVFGEKQSLSYTIHFVTYNLVYIVKFLAFQYDCKMEVLKLEIEPQICEGKKELEYCCNYLKRRRNLNLLFSAVTQFSRLIEARRLICDLIVKKINKTHVDRNEDGGIIIMYSDVETHIKIGIIWNIKCNSKQDITDVIEVYYKNVDDCWNKNEIKDKLVKITEANLSFTSKYHLWKELFQEVECKCIATSPKPSSVEVMDTSEAEGVVCVSDSEDSVPGSGPHKNGEDAAPRETSCPKSLMQFKAMLSPPLFVFGAPNNRKIEPNSVDDEVIPTKKIRTHAEDDEIEITSITYVVPD